MLKNILRIILRHVCYRHDVEVINLHSVTTDPKFCIPESYQASAKCDETDGGSRRRRSAGGGCGEEEINLEWLEGMLFFSIVLTFFQVLNFEILEFEVFIF